ncbi:hypothetical protein ASG24_01495 [Methylophilus sp. Leaf414]|nr:hypothetical protein ASG24_01495 [Methylophilus sp. Leaf414]
MPDLFKGWAAPLLLFGFHTQIIIKEPPVTEAQKQELSLKIVQLNGEISSIVHALMQLPAEAQRLPPHASTIHGLTQSQQSLQKLQQAVSRLK